MIYMTKASLSNKIVTSLTVMFLVIVVAFGIVVSMVFENTILASEKQKADLLIKTIEKPIQMALFLKFYDQIAEKVSPVTLLPDVSELIITDNNGKIVYHYLSKGMKTKRHEPIVLEREMYEPLSQNKIMGTIILSYSDLAYDETRHSILTIAYGIALLVAILFFVAAWWIRYLLSPLNTIANTVRNYAPGNSMTLKEHGSVEIEQIVNAFNSMQKTTQDYFWQIESINASLEQIVEEKTHKLIEQYYLDQLTGLPNRYQLQERLQHPDVVALAILNIDDFKELNDFFGIIIGDEMLIHMGKWLREVSSLCYRIGGDEFAILFTESELDQSELKHRLKRLIELLDAKTFIINKDESLRLRITVGVAFGAEKALTRADIALNRAKKDKKQVAFYNQDEGVEEQYRSNMVMAAMVRKALFEHRFVCHYQPIVTLKTGITDKYETLIRMLDEEGNLVPPMKFLPIAKQTKLYPQITLEMVSQACTLFSTRTEEFSMNVADSDIRNPETVQEILKIITDTGVASRVVFEILESEGIENYDDVSLFIEKVKALGAKIAIDDFGTGYSNFENILKLNVDYIKIDGSLIRGIANHQRHRIIVETIVDFARKIGAKTIAEFVSDKETYEAICTLGIDYSQGYFTGKPIPLP